MSFDIKQKAELAAIALQLELALRRAEKSHFSLAAARISEAVDAVRDSLR